MLVTISASCQDYGKLKLVSHLPGKAKEISGIEYFQGEDVIWFINDSRNPPEIYGLGIDNSKVEQTIRLTNASNIDWEDLARDNEGNLYIGDFGNNDSNREDLTIYGITQPGTLKSRRNKATITTFRFEDQNEFPPKEKDLSYDVESFIFLKGNFYLFTRNRAKKFDGKTKIYRLPAKEGDFVAELIGSYKTGNDASDCQVTSAAVHHESGTIALLSYNKVWIFSDYKEDDFASGKVREIKLKHSSQKESICFKSARELYIADERSKGEGRNLYLLNLDEE